MQEEFKLKTPSAVDIISLLPLVDHLKWQVDYAGRIRSYPGEWNGYKVCPLVAVVDELGFDRSGSLGLAYREAWRKLGEDHINICRDLHDFIEAVDNLQGHCPAIRASILRHLGLPAEDH